MTKHCSKCKVAQPSSEFFSNKKTKDKLQSQCKTCMREDNRLRYEKRNVQTLAWMDNNPDRWSAIKGKMTAVRRFPKCVPPDYNHELCTKVYAERNRLTQETGVEHHVDHIVSLKQGGLHHHTNLQVLTAAENMAKG